MPFLDYCSIEHSSVRAAKTGIWVAIAETLRFSLYENTAKVMQTQLSFLLFAFKKTK